nr:hypothetical protein [Candidatus Woesearchaeota archaeon]
MKLADGAVKESLTEMLRQHYIENRLLPNYFLLPGRRHGKYEYFDLRVSMHRLGFPIDTMYDLATKALGFRVENTAQEKNGTSYIGNIDYGEALRLNLALGNLTLNLRQFFDFKEYLESEKVYDGNGKIVDNRKVESVWNEIFEKRNPWRGEHIDARFENKNGIWYMHRDHRRLVNGILAASYSEPLEEGLMEDDKISDVHINEQGMPVRKHSFNYWHPRNDSVARFWAGSGRVGLYCDGNPQDSNSGLGVRAVEILTK